jgi:glucose/arabinose dehydrogenase
MKPILQSLFKIALALPMVLASGADQTQPVQPGGKLPGNIAIKLIKVADDLAEPVNVAAPNDGTGRLFIIERPGVIQVIKDGKKQKRPFLDLKDKTISSFLELGMFSMAFHPDFKNNGKVYVCYADLWFNGASMITEFTVSKANPDKIDPDSAKVIMQIDFPYCNHHGGQIAFGPDGYLYIGVGDGGWEGDVIDAAQQLPRQDAPHRRQQKQWRPRLRCPEEQPVHHPASTDDPLWRQRRSFLSRSSARQI